jgi:hypothetical protein
MLALYGYPLLAGGRVGQARGCEHVFQSRQVLTGKVFELRLSVTYRDRMEEENDRRECIDQRTGCEG